jgi:Acetyltransferase (GNAT) domain
VYCDKALIGYCTLEHIDTANSNCEIGLVIGNPVSWHEGLGTLVVRRLTTLAFTTYHLHRVYAVIQEGNIASMRCVVGMLLCGASPQLEPHPEPLCMVCWLDWANVHGGIPRTELLTCVLLEEAVQNVL